MYKAYETPWDERWDDYTDAWDWEIKYNYFAVDGNDEMVSFECDVYTAVKDFLNDEDATIEPYRRGAFTEDELDILYDRKNTGRYPTKTEALSIVTGHKWESTTIRGVVQSDWNVAYYDTTVISDVTDFERRYFNTGSEWKIIDNDGEKVWHYTTKWDEDEIREELADVAGCAPSELAMFKFDGYTQTPNYKLI